MPAWEAEYAGGNVGWLIDAMFEPVGKFGKVLMGLERDRKQRSNDIFFWHVLPDIHTIASGRSQIRILSGRDCGKDNPTIRPWAAGVLVEHLYFRKGDFALYDLQSWNEPPKLPLGAAALTASALRFALVIPSMGLVWYKGLIALTTGNIGIEMAMAVTTLLYIPLCHLEKRWKGV
ncbi:hypothetical protein EDB89DRAFT_2241538 [Lactarius sanguifluus]|nr:hypothetical protein EDB89DRAFT_2241538 [Lactarius sanguifluus]